MEAPAQTPASTSLDSPQHPAVQLHRIDRNAGIIGGLRFCLERAKRRYVVPLDSDDLLTPDAVRVLSHALKRSGYPALAYSDEDKVEADHSEILTSSLTGILSCSSTPAISRTSARSIASLPSSSERTPIPTPRAVMIGTRSRDSISPATSPLHVPEVFYSWRMHAESTAGNIGSKPYVSRLAAQGAQQGAVCGADPALYDLQPSPLFNGTPDWWIRRGRRDPLAGDHRSRDGTRRRVG